MSAAKNKQMCILLAIIMQYIIIAHYDLFVKCFEEYFSVIYHKKDVPQTPKNRQKRFFDFFSKKT